MSETALPSLAPLSDAPDQLELRKESWKKSTMDLVDGDTSFARMDYAYWTGKGRAAVAGHEWAFSRPKGFTKNRIAITEGPDGATVAELDLETWSRGGEVELDGGRYVLDAEGWLKPEWTCTRDGEELFAIKDTGSFGKKKAHAHLTALGRQDPNLGLLLLLTVHAKASQDSSMTAATSANAGAMTAATS